MTVTGPVAGQRVESNAPEQAALEAVRLTKHFRLQRRGRMSERPVVHAVEDVSLALRPGRITALVGESGSGKSTLARMLALHERPTSGDVLLGGVPIHLIRGRSQRAYRRQVQMIFQDPFASLNPVHRVEYHLKRPIRVHKHARSRDAVDQMLEETLERVNLTPARQFLAKYPHELSGGQRQRVAIARALAVRPTVLIADEPVSMLDVSIRLGILNLLRDLAKRDGLAILYVTHDIASARYFADEISVLYAGQLVESGPPEQVTQEPAHPYTQLLLAAAPDPQRSRRQRRALPQRSAKAPDLIQPVSGCRFHPRCPHAMAACLDETPPRHSLGNGRDALCWLPVAAAEPGAPRFAPLDSTPTRSNHQQEERENA